jgi:hypothetical protein
MDDTDLRRSSRGVEVWPSRSRPALYSWFSVQRSCAIVCASVCSCCLLAWACGTDNQMNLSTATAGTRYETGSRDKHRSTMSMVKSRLCYQSHQAMSDLGLKSTNAHSKRHSLCQARTSIFGIDTLAPVFVRHLSRRSKEELG